MLWATSPSLLTGTVCLRLVRAILPAILLWIPKQILDGLISALQTHGDLRRIWSLLILELLLGLTSEMMSQANSVLDDLLGERFTCYVTVRLMDHAALLDLSSFEEPVFYDKLERVRGQATGRVFLLTSVLNAAQEASTLLTLSAALVVFSPWLMVLLAASSIPTFIGEAHFSRLSYSAFFHRTPQRRELEYFRFLASWAQSAKEMRIFGLASQLSARYRVLSEKIYRENKELLTRRGLGGWISATLSLLGYYAGYVIVLKSTLTGFLSIGSFTFLTGSFSRARLSISKIFSSLNGISEQAMLLIDLFDFFRMTPNICSKTHSLAVPYPIRRGFEFRNVTFAYPGSEQFVVRDINFRINPSETVALVGVNGSGKTTLIKLLCRLYDPVCGQILLDGIDLREYDLVQLRNCIGVIFQDFIRYDLSVRDNIAFGGIESLNDLSRLAVAARNGGAADLISSLKLGYDQILGRRFKNGVELSGGEWQRVALSRAFARDAQLFIFDEPTSSLDGATECDFFNRLDQRLEGRMAVLISHRLSAARTADNIVVLEAGGVIEQGSHGQLLSLGGRYAAMFAVQAAAFRGDKDN